MGVCKKKFEEDCKNFEKKITRGRPRKSITCNCDNKTMDYIRKVELLNFDGNIAENWRTFKQNYEIFYIAGEINKKSEAVQNAVGPAAVEVFNSFNLDENKKKVYVEIIKAFDEFCRPKTNELYETFVFHRRSQGVNEPFDQFLMDIKKLIRTCGFGELENRMLRDRIVCGVADKNLQKRLLEADKLDCDRAIDMARAAEVTSFQSMDIRMGVEKRVDIVDAIKD